MTVKPECQSKKGKTFPLLVWMLVFAFQSRVLTSPNHSQGYQEPTLDPPLLQNKMMIGLCQSCGAVFSDDLIHRRKV